MVDFRDAGLDPVRSGEYRLTMEISDRSFRFAIFHDDLLLRLNEIALESTTPSNFVRKTEESLQKIDELKWGFRSRSVSYAATRYTLIPLELFDKSRVSELFTFNFQKSRDEEVSYDLLEGKRIAVVYAQPSMFRSMLMRLFNFKPFDLTAHVSSLIGSVLKRDVFTGLVVNIRESVFDLMFVDKGQLIFCNSFRYQAPEDVSFYTLNLVDQLKLPPDIHAEYYGMISPGDKIESLLGKYLKGWVRGLEENNHPEYYTLLSQHKQPVQK